MYVCIRCMYELRWYLLEFFFSREPGNFICLLLVLQLVW